MLFALRQSLLRESSLRYVYRETVDEEGAVRACRMHARVQAKVAVLAAEGARLELEAVHVTVLLQQAQQLRAPVLVDVDLARQIGDMLDYLLR